jgi:hypothetical protein
MVKRKKDKKTKKDLQKITLNTKTILIFFLIDRYLCRLGVPIFSLDKIKQKDRNFRLNLRKLKKKDIDDR